MSVTWRFIHYSATALGPIESRTQRLNMLKPDGLWFSCEAPGEYGWAEWCRGENFNIERLARQFEIFPDLGTTLWLETPEDIDEFDHEYRIPDSYVPGRYTPDWPQVARDYHGLIIAPYQWSRRLPLDGGHLWYYGWDCASGVIWTAEAALEVREVTSTAAADPVASLT